MGAVRVVRTAAFCSVVRARRVAVLGAACGTAKVSETVADAVDDEVGKWAFGLG